MSRVKLDSVSKRYRNTVVVDRLTIDVPDGEFLVLVGPSGCGKSTTLNLIAGLDTVSDGRIFIGERDVTRLPPKARQVAMVFQNYALYPHMTVERNLGFALTVAKMRAQEVRRLVGQIAETLGITDLLERYPRELSGGQRQRVALGRAMVRDPAVFLFDEPLSNLDAQLRVQMRFELKQLHRRLGATAIYVTHDQVEAMTLGSRVVVMDRGVVQQMGSPLEIYDRPQNRFVAQFMGSPPMNFLDCAPLELGGHTLLECGSAHFQLTDGNVQAIGRANSSKLVLGIRPEHVAVFDTPVVHSIPVRVETVDALGNQTLLNLSMSGTRLIAAAPPSCTFRGGEQAYVVLNPERIRLFEAGGQGNAL